MFDSQLYINKPKSEAIFKFLSLYARQQSDREVPCTPFQNGVTDLTRLNGHEYRGLVMLTMVALKVLLHDKVPIAKQKDIIDSSRRGSASASLMIRHIHLRRGCPANCLLSDVVP
jgi:hypothetical protein